LESVSTSLPPTVLASSLLPAATRRSRTGRGRFSARPRRRRVSADRDRADRADERQRPAAYTQAGHCAGAEHGEGGYIDNRGDDASGSSRTSVKPKQPDLERQQVPAENPEARTTLPAAYASRRPVSGIATASRKAEIICSRKQRGRWSESSCTRSGTSRGE